MTIPYYMEINGSLDPGTFHKWWDSFWIMINPYIKMLGASESNLLKKSGQGLPGYLSTTTIERKLLVKLDSCSKVEEKSCSYRRSGIASPSTQFLLMVEPTQYAQVKLDHETPRFGVKIQKMFELPPPRISMNFPIVSHINHWFPLIRPY